MPVYGVEEYIGVCVDSILTQTYDNIEVLVIDDCSQDNSISILNEHVAQSGRAFSWKIIKQQENGGLSAARNAGIREASGKYIFFLDSDDKLMPNCIKDLVTEAELSHSDVTTGNRISLDWHTGKKYRMIENDYVPARTNSLKELMKIQLHGTVWNKLIKRDFYSQTQSLF